MTKTSGQLQTDLYFRLLEDSRNATRSKKYDEALRAHQNFNFI